MSVLAIIAVAYTAGCGVGSVRPVPEGVGLGLTAISILCVFLSRNHPTRFTVLSMLTAFNIGWGRPPSSSAVDEKPLSKACHRLVEGAMEAPPIEFPDHQQLRIRIHRLSACLDGPEIGSLSPKRGTLLVTLVDERVDIRRGDAVRLRAHIKPMVPRQNPGAKKYWSSTPLYSAIISSKEMIVRTTLSDAAYRHPFDAFRARLSKGFTAAMPSRPAAMACALSLGERHQLPFDMKESFRLTGVAHLLSVSGLHLGLTTLFVFGVLHFLLVRTTWARAQDVGRVAALLTIPFAIGFALVTGLRAPVLRATIMSSSVLLGRALGRSNATPEAMGLAAILILLVHPESLHSPGFQLSFAAVAGFCFVFSFRKKRRESIMFPEETSRSKPRPLRAFFKKLFLTSLAATAATAPLLILHFGALPLLGLAVNLFAIPLVGFCIMPVLLVGMAVFPFSAAVFETVIQPAIPLLELLDSTLTALSRLPMTINDPSPMLTVVICLVSVAVISFGAQLPKAGKAFSALGLMILCLSLFMDRARIPKDKLTIHFFDVGQGDSALITTPGGRHFLVDAGGKFGDRFDAGRDVVIPAFRALGVTELEALILTHPDQDHAGGVPFVLENIKVRALWENGHGEHLGVEDSYGDALKTARARNIAVLRTPEICGTRTIDSVTFEVVHPCDTQNGFNNTLSTNDNAIVLSTRFGSHSIAFMADVGEAIEKQLVADKRLRQADIVKIGHHGSRTSTSAVLLDTLAPGAAVISVAPFNRFKMPHPSVLERLSARQIRTYRTDLSGAVSVTTDGRLFSIRTERRLDSRE